MIDGLCVGEVARPLTPLTPEDTVARAAEILRSVPFDRLPVVVGDRLVGVVTERALTDALQGVYQGIASPDQIRLMPVAHGLIAPVTPLAAAGNLRDAAMTFWLGAGSLPVADADGRYVGMLSQPDLADTLFQARRPPTIGGMATPLGVYLTTGTANAGARGSLGLVLSGAAMALALVLAMVLTSLLGLAVERFTGIPVRASLESPSIGMVDLNRYDIWRHLLPLLEILIFMVLLRLSPLTGYHAAEHQVVHAVERERPLTPESVARMPRAHPRCGTRFFAIGVLLTLFGSALPLADNTIGYVLAVVAILLWWRPLGHHLQNWVTTKPATIGQLRSAIAAAEELLTKHQHAPARRMTLGMRIWQMGLPQVLLGSVLVMTVLTQLAARYGLLLLW